MIHKRGGQVFRAQRAIAKTVRLIQTGGYAGLVERAVRAADARFGATGPDSLPLRPSELADSGRLKLAVPSRPVERERALSIGWIIAPPGLGSGGHTTLFRMVEAAESAGHRCILYLYDRNRCDLQQHASVLQQGWPHLRVEIADVRDGIRGVDAAVASSWPTAHALATFGASPVHRLYFIQDFEPYFYPRGSEYSFAEDTYRFGFKNIALGNMVADLLRSEIGDEPDVAEFGCDTSVYRLVNGAQRNGVLFYAKPTVPRRGYSVGELALEEFHSRHPDQEIHIYGDRPQRPRYPATFHSRLTPEELASLYNRCIAGIGISFTNLSLVVEEMLACGVVPVVNDSPARTNGDIPSPHVAWSKPTPGALADRLAAAVRATDLTQQAAVVAASARTGWVPAQRTVVAAIEREAYGLMGRGRETGNCPAVGMNPGV